LPGDGRHFISNPDRYWAAFGYRTQLEFFALLLSNKGFLSVHSVSSDKPYLFETMA
jgi:hypothetical protein